MAQPDDKPASLSMPSVEAQFKYALTNEQRQKIESMFTYHPPKNDQPSRYMILRQSAKALAALMCLNCPESRELSLALTNLQQATMWANAAIAVNE